MENYISVSVKSLFWHSILRLQIISKFTRIMWSVPSPLSFENILMQFIVPPATNVFRGILQSACLSFCQSVSAKNIGEFSVIYSFYKFAAALKLPFSLNYFVSRTPTFLFPFSSTGRRPNDLLSWHCVCRVCLSVCQFFYASVNSSKNFSPETIDWIFTKFQRNVP